MLADRGYWMLMTNWTLKGACLLMTKWKKINNGINEVDECINFGRGYFKDHNHKLLKKILFKIVFEFDAVRVVHDGGIDENNQSQKDKFSSHDVIEKCLKIDLN